MPPEISPEDSRKMEFPENLDLKSPWYPLIFSSMTICKSERMMGISNYSNENPSIWGHFIPVNFNFLQPWWKKNPWFGGIFQLMISNFSLTLVKSFTLFPENPSIWGHFRTNNFKHFSTMVKSFTLVLENPSIWGHFWTVFIIFFNHGEVIHCCT